MAKTMFGMLPPKAMKGSPMTDKGKHVSVPKVGQDFDEKTRVAGSGPSRDGPARSSASPKPQKPATSGKAMPMTKLGKSTMMPKAKAPMKSSMPQGTVNDVSQPAPAKQQNAGILSQSGMPAASTIVSMKQSLKGMGRFGR